MEQTIILERRRQVYETLCRHSKTIKSGSIEKISAGDLELLYTLYDTLFFDHWFKRHLEKAMTFSLSKRMTRSAGMTLFKKKKIASDQGHLEIRISVDFLFNFERGQREKSVGGIVAQDSLEALMLVFEHELCHAYEFALRGNSSCRQKPFKELIQNLFGHTQSTHKLLTISEITRETLGYQVGGIYTFMYKSHLLEGQLTAIHKNAVMMVKDPKGRYKNAQGIRFTKFYVGIHRLNNC